MALGCRSCLLHMKGLKQGGQNLLGRLAGMGIASAVLAG